LDDAMLQHRQHAQDYQQTRLEYGREAGSVLGAMRNPGGPILPPLLQMYLALEWEGWRSPVNEDSQLPQLYQLHQSSGLNRDNIHLSIYIRGSALPLPCCQFKTADVRVPATSLIRIFCQ
jgi:hypothetical protein